MNSTAFDGVVFIGFVRKIYFNKKKKKKKNEILFIRVLFSYAFEMLFTKQRIVCLAIYELVVKNTANFKCVFFHSFIHSHSSCTETCITSARYLIFFPTSILSFINENSENTAAGRIEHCYMLTL